MDALTVNGASNPVANVVVDHVTMIWGPDIGGLAVLGDVRNMTVQNSIMGEEPVPVRSWRGDRRAGRPQHRGEHHSGNLNPISLRRETSPSGETSSPPPTRACRASRGRNAWTWSTASSTTGARTQPGNPRSLNLVNNWYQQSPDGWPAVLGGADERRLFARSVRRSACRERRRRDQGWARRRRERVRGESTLRRTVGGARRPRWRLCGGARWGRSHGSVRSRSAAGSSETSSTGRANTSTGR